MLNGDPAAQSPDPFDVPIRNGFGVIEEPMQPVQRHFPVHLLVSVQRVFDRFVVGRVHAKRPTVLREERHDLS